MNNSRLRDVSEYSQQALNIYNNDEKYMDEIHYTNNVPLVLLYPLSVQRRCMLE